MKKIIILLLILSTVFFSGMVHSEEGELTVGMSTDDDEEVIVDFNFSNIYYDVDCFNDTVNIYGIDIISLEEVESVEYSLNGGLSWISMDSLQFSLLNIPFEKGLLVLKFKVISENDTFISVDTYVSNDCVDDMILGFLFQNHNEIAITNSGGDILLNPNHDLEIVIETSYGISEVKVGDGKTFENLNYDFSTKLWSTVIPKDLLSNDVNSLVVIADGIEKNLPDILNVSLLDENDNFLVDDYIVYYFNNYEWKRMFYSEDEVNYSIFSLLPGKYYVKLKNDIGWVYSSVFEISERSIVSFSSAESTFPAFFQWLERFFVSLDFEIFNSHFELDGFLFENDFTPSIEEFISKDSIFMYMNSWNPLFKEHLVVLENLSENYDIILFTDSNSFNVLNSVLKKYDDSFRLYEVDFVDELTRYQTEVFFFDSGSNDILSIRNFNFLNNLIK